MEQGLGMPENSGFTIHNARELQVPLLVSVPHAGRDYPEAIFKNLRLRPDVLVRLEDRYADLLARDAIGSAVPTIVAHRARAWIDLNRDETDIDADLVDGVDRANMPAPGTKQRGGLGLIPRRLSGAGDIWLKRIALADVNVRIATFHRPYHLGIEGILARMREKFGVAILLDLHSMPPLHMNLAKKSPQIVVGDLFGRSAATRFSEILMKRLGQAGFQTALNNPYSGDHILRRHGDIDGGTHAIQLEIDRSLYLDDIMREPGQGLVKMSRIVAEMVQILADEALGNRTLMAAE
jgi:N-formylglutamate amidohydrolase